jgi:hypothetical protein
MPGDPTHLTDGLVEQHEQVVQRYALQLREMAATERRRVARGIGTRRAYEILNECAMELARMTREQNAAAPDERDPTRR